jgi:hypothetical protein
MSLRSLSHWLIRGGLLAVLAVVGYAGWWARDWVSPENVRTALITRLEQDFPGSTARVGTAQLRLLGGISVTDLALTRSGESEPYFAAPAGVIYHEKEQLNRGRLVVRKVELDEAIIRLDRRADGTWSLAGVTADAGTDSAVPTLVVRNAMVHVTDHSAKGLPAFTVRAAKVQLVNDPLPVLKFDATGVVTLTVDPPLELPVSVSAKVNRITRHAAVHVDLPEIALGPAVAAAARAVKPDWADILDRVSAVVAVKADLTYTPATPTPLRSDVRLEIKQGRLDDPIFPWPLEHIAGVVHVQDGRVRIDEKEKLSAALGQARLDLTLETRSDEAAGEPEPSDEIQFLEQRLQALTLSARNLPLTDEVFARLPERAHKMRDLFSPKGAVDVTYRFSRPPTGWRREVDVRPNGLSMEYAKFRYPVSDLSGWLKKTVAQDGTDEMIVQISGKAKDRNIDLRGRTAGSGEDPFIDLRVSGDDIPIDDALFNALPREKYRASLRKLGANGRGNFVATIHQDLNRNYCESKFAVTVTDGTIRYALFPYPLEKVKGEVLIDVTTVTETRTERPGEPIRPLPDTDVYEIRHLTARHSGGELWLDGVNKASANGIDRTTHLSVKGKECPLDASFQTALESIKLAGVQKAVTPTGAITFGIEADVLDRVSPDPAKPDPAFDPSNDLKLTINFRGPTVTPGFFPYTFTDLAGVIRYQGSSLDLVNVSGRHDRSRWGLDAGEVRFASDGGVWANLGGLSISPVVPDTAFLNALPVGLQKGFRDLNLQGPMDLAVRHLVIAAPARVAGPAPEPIAINAGAGGRLRREPDPIVFWDAKLTLGGASFDTGRPWVDVFGSLGCTGRYEGDRLGAVTGTVWLDRAVVADQPLARVKATVSTEPQQPTATNEPVVVKVTDAAGSLFNGFVGGEARIVLSDPPRYRLWLTASDVRLDEVARHYHLGQDAELKGTAQGRIVLENAVDPKTGTLVLKGDGSIDVPTGRMYNLPVLLDLVKLAKFQAPDQTAFEEAHAAFRIQGDKVFVDHVDLIGSAVSLGGSGELDATGRHVKFEFYTVWSQTLKRWLTTPLGDMTAAVSDNLFRIEMTRGPDGNLKYEPRFVPAVTDPVRALAERFRKRTMADPTPTVRAAGK